MSDQLYKHVGVVLTGESCGGKTPEGETWHRLPVAAAWSVGAGAIQSQLKVMHEWGSVPHPTAAAGAPGEPVSLPLTPLTDAVP